MLKIMMLHYINIVMHATSLQSCLTLCDPVDCSPPAPLSMGFSKQENWSGLLCPSPGNLPHPGIEPVSSAAPTLQADSLPPRTLIDNKIPCSKEVAPIYPSIYSICVFPLFHISLGHRRHLLSLVFLFELFLLGVSWYLNLVIIFISLIPSEIETFTNIY